MISGIGPEIARSRTQFMKRLVAFSDRHQLALELAYYPPYHSKYNLIERCWGILENHWNGALLKSIETAVDWVQTKTWRVVIPIAEKLAHVRLAPVGQGLPYRAPGGASPALLEAAQQMVSLPRGAGFTRSCI